MLKKLKRMRWVCVKRGVATLIRIWMSARRTLTAKFLCPPPPLHLRATTLSARRRRRPGSVSGRSSNENSNSSRKLTKHSYRSNRRQGNPRASMCFQRMKMSNRGKVMIKRCWPRRNWSLTSSALASRSPPSVPRDRGWRQKKQSPCLRYNN